MFCLVEKCWTIRDTFFCVVQGYVTSRSVLWLLLLYVRQSFMPGQTGEACIFVIVLQVLRVFFFGDNRLSV